MTSTSVFYDNSFKGHVSSLNNPECSSRVKNILKLIKKEDFRNISIFEPNEIDIKLITVNYELIHIIMDLGQRKLSKEEWDSLEISVSPEELKILKMI